MESLNDFLNSLSSDFLHLDYRRVALNALLAMILSQVLAWHYMRFAQVLSNKRKFAKIFMLITTTTLLVITIVGSSLQLSLGLVGALSIIRFRTPVKEPEELAYLFLAIGTGIGLGADQPVITGMLFALILTYLTARHYTSKSADSLRTVLQVSARMNGHNGTRSGRPELKALMPAVQASCSRVDLRRVDCHGDEFNASLLVELEDSQAIGSLLDGLQHALPGAVVSVVERDGLD